MEKHVTVLGALYIAYSVLGLLFAAIVLVSVVGGGLLSGDLQAIAVTSTVGSAIASFLAVLSVPGLIGGLGLLNRRSWARILVLVLGFLNLFNIPLGTILGIYTIWVLLNDETARLFDDEVRGQSDPKDPVTIK